MPKTNISILPSPELATPVQSATGKIKQCIIVEIATLFVCHEPKRTWPRNSIFLQWPERIWCVHKELLNTLH